MEAVRDVRGLVLQGPLSPPLLSQLTVSPIDTGYGRSMPFCLARPLGSDSYAIPKCFEVPGCQIVDDYSDSTVVFPDAAITLDPEKRQDVAFESALRSLEATGGALLSLPTGYGKTVVAIAIMARMSVKAAVLVHTKVLEAQWRERLDRFLPGRPPGSVEILMLQTAALRQTLRPDLGLVVVDEAHHIAAPMFSRAMVGLSARYTLGLSATPTRKDGLSRVIEWFLGPLCYAYERTNESLVQVRRVFYRPESYKTQRPPTLWNGKPSLPRMITMLTEDRDRNLLIMEWIRRCVSQSRCVLALTDRREHAAQLCRTSLAEGLRAGVYVGGLKEAELRRVAAEADVIFGTYSIAHEGMDNPRLNTLVFCTPKSDVVQAVGRILRGSFKEPHPMIVDIVDCWASLFSQSKKRERTYVKSGFVLDGCEVGKAGVCGRWQLGVPQADGVGAPRPEGHLGGVRDPREDDGGGGGACERLEIDGLQS